MQLLIDTDATPKAQLAALIVLLQAVHEGRPDITAATTTGVEGKVSMGLTPIITVSELPPPGIFGGEPLGEASAAPSVSVAGSAPVTASAASGGASESNVTYVVSHTSYPPVAELDNELLPWDARIHAASKSKVGGGTWRIKRGITDEFYNSTVAALREAYPAPEGAIVPPPPVAAVPAPPPPPPPSDTVTPPPTNIGITSPIPSGTVQGPSFRDLMVKVAGLVQQGRIKNEDIPNIIRQVTAGAVNTVQDLVTAQNYIGPVLAYLNTLYPVQGQ